MCGVLLLLNLIDSYKIDTASSLLEKKDSFKESDLLGGLDNYSSSKASAELVFASYLHARITRSWQGKKPAIIASVGFIVIWVCYLGVNFLGKGLHTYGKIIRKRWYLYGY